MEQDALSTTVPMTLKKMTKEEKPKLDENRLLILFTNEALSVVETKDVSVEDLKKIASDKYAPVKPVFLGDQQNSETIKYYVENCGDFYVMFENPDEGDIAEACDKYGVNKLGVQNIDRIKQSWGVSII